MEIEVKHNEKEHRFECVKEGQLAYVEYKKILDGMDFIATFVPEELRGKGVGSALAKAALRYAEGKRMKVVASCPFIRSYIEKHMKWSKV